MAKAVPRDERNLFLHTLADFLESSKGPIIFIAGRRKEVSSANNTAAGQFHPLVFLYLFWCVILVIVEILIPDLPWLYAEKPSFINAKCFFQGIN
mgnify:FL=1